MRSTPHLAQVVDDLLVGGAAAEALLGGEEALQQVLGHDARISRCPAGVLLRQSLQWRRRRRHCAALLGARLLLQHGAERLLS